MSKKDKRRTDKTFVRGDSSSNQCGGFEEEVIASVTKPTLAIYDVYMYVTLMSGSVGLSDSGPHDTMSMTDYLKAPIKVALPDDCQFNQA